MNASVEGLPRALSRALSERGFDRLSEVQDAVRAADAVSGGGLLVLAPTGSGKTIAFGIAIAKVREAPGGAASPALVVVPTRELAHQVARELELLFQHTGWQVALCVSGPDMDAQSRNLAGTFDVLVGTPRRLRDQIARGALDPRAFGCLVIDEADELLGGDYDDDMAAFGAALGDAARPLICVAAARTPALDRALAALGRSLAVVEAGGGRERLRGVDLSGIEVAPLDRDRCVADLLRLHHPASAIVFCNRRTDVARLTGKLMRRGFAVQSLSGGMRNAERLAAISQLTHGAARICVATDVASRGLDLRRLDLVIHAGVPETAHVLLHRSGRVGRAGRTGRAVFVVTAGERRKVERFCNLLGRTVAWMERPAVEHIRDADLARLPADPVFSEPANAYDALLAGAIRRHLAPDAISLACARLWREAQPLAGDLGLAGAAAPEGGQADGRVWLGIESGALGRAQIGEILRLICGTCGIDRAEVGRIHAGRGVTRFEVKAAVAAGILARAERETGARRVWRAESRA